MKQKPGSDHEQQWQQIEQRIFSNFEILDFLQFSAWQRFTDDHYESGEKFLNSFEYEPSEEELCYYPDLYEPAIEKAKLVAKKDLPTEKLNLFIESLELAKDAWSVCA